MATLAKLHDTILRHHGRDALAMAAFTCPQIQNPEEPTSRYFIKLVAAAKAPAVRRVVSLAPSESGSPQIYERHVWGIPHDKVISQHVKSSDSNSWMAQFRDANHLYLYS